MNKYLRKALHYSAGNLFNKILLIVFLPIFTHYMLPKEYAIYTNFMIFIAFLQPLFLAGFNQSIFPYFHTKKTDEYKYTLIFSMYIIIVIVGILFSAVIFYFRYQIAEVLVRDAGYADLILWVIIIIMAQSIHSITLSILNLMERSTYYAVLGTVNNLLLLILFGYGAVSSQFSIKDVFFYMTIASIVSGLISFIFLGKMLQEFRTENAKRFSFEIMQPVLKFGIIMIPGTFALLILRVIDRYMLTYLSPKALYDVGIYAVAYKIGMIMQFLVAVVSLVFYPYAMRIAEEKFAKETFQKIFNLFVLGGTLLGIAIILFSDEIFYLFIDPKYVQAAKIVFIGVISTYLHGVFNIVKIGFYVTKCAKKIAFVVIAAALMNIGLNYLLIPIYGIYGAGIASIASYIMIIVLNNFAIKKIYYVKYSLRSLAISLLLMGAIATVNIYLSNSILVTFIKIISMSIIIYLSYIYLSKTGKLKFIIQTFKKE